MKSYALTKEERNLLSEEDKKKYDKAILYCDNWWSRGPFNDGWSNGHDLLKELGWKEESRIEGHRKLITLIKPQRLTYKEVNL